jgi:hypothetical protein
VCTVTAAACSVGTGISIRQHADLWGSGGCDARILNSASWKLLISHFTPGKKSCSIQLIRGSVDARDGLDVKSDRTRRIGTDVRFIRVSRFYSKCLKYRGFVICKIK